MRCRLILTTGLNNPPEILKNAHALTAREKPKAREINSKLEESGVCVSEPSAVAGAAALATWVAAKAMKRNINVPPNSPRRCQPVYLWKETTYVPIHAINSFRTQLGAKANRFSRLSLYLWMCAGFDGLSSASFLWNGNKFFTIIYFAIERQPQRNNKVEKE